MIDTRNESLLTLAEVSELLRKHVATVYRWSTTGYGGVVLETIQIGGTRCTSHEAVQQFCERLTGLPRAPTRRVVEPTVGAEKAAKELDRYGL